MTGQNNLFPKFIATTFRSWIEKAVGLSAGFSPIIERTNWAKAREMCQQAWIHELKLVAMRGTSPFNPQNWAFRYSVFESLQRNASFVTIKIPYSGAPSQKATSGSPHTPFTTNDLPS